MTIVASEWSTAVSFKVRDLGSSYAELARIIPPGLAQGDQFGCDIALNRDATVALIGAYGDDTGFTDAGRVYFYKRVNDTWVFQSYIVSPSPSLEEHFGTSVALDSEATVALIGAQYNDGANTDAGCVYFYTRSGDSWVYQSVFYSADIAAGQRFGGSVSLSADGMTAYVSAVRDARFAASSGAGYVFKRTGVTWTQYQKLVSSSPAYFGAFGRGKISPDGNYILVGQAGASDALSGNGSVEVFKKVGDFWVFQSKITPVDAELNKAFGFTVTCNYDASYMVVGASGDNGKAPVGGACYLYRREGSLWILKQKLYPSDTEADIAYGSGVGMSYDGATMLVGAYRKDTGQTDTGAVYAYDLSVKGLAEQQKFYSTDSAADDLFGVSVALNADGDYAMVGAENRDDGAYNTGAVYAFSRNGSVWTQRQKFDSPDGVTIDYFGRAVALNQDATIALIGAPGDDDTQSGSGSVYVYTRINDVWTFQQKIHAGDPIVNANFGGALAINGDGTRALIGALGDSTQGVNAGAVYFYTRSGSVWIQQAKIFAPGAKANDGFGGTVALSQDGLQAFVASYYSSDSLASQGSVYYYLFDGAAWVYKQKFYAPDPAVNDCFGVGLSLNGVGDVALIGAHQKDDKAVDAGGVYQFTRTGLVWSFSKKLYQAEALVGNGFGISTALSADATYALIGAHLSDEHGNNSGTVTAWVDGEKVKARLLSEALIERCKFYPNDGAAGDYFGVAVAMTPDASFALVGACFDSDAAVNAGAVYAYTRSGIKWTQQYKFYSPEPNPTQLFGVGVAISADGQHALVSAEDTTGGPVGHVYYFRKRGDAWSYVSKFTGTDTLSGQLFGRSVAMSADGNYCVVGASAELGAGSGGLNSGTGSAYCFTRSGDVWTQVQKVIAPDAAALDYFGIGVAVNSDASIVMISSPLDDSPLADAGSVYVYTRSGNTLTYQQKLTMPNAVAGSGFGASVSLNSTGDIALIGQLPAGEHVVGGGAIHLYKRVGASWTFVKRLFTTDTSANDAFGFASVLNADGSMALVGASGDADRGASAGSVYFLATGDLDTVVLKERGSFIAPDTLTGDQFGVGVAMNAAGNYALVGATGVDASGADIGVVYVYTRSGGVWSEQQRFTAASPIAGDGFGETIALSADGTMALIGTTKNDVAGVDSGRVYYYIRTGDLWNYQGFFTAPDVAAEDLFGASIAANAAFDYALIGSYRNDNATGSDGGAVYVFTRSGSNWTFQQKLTHVDGGCFGVGVALNATGDYALISALDQNGAAFSSGVVHVYTRAGAVWTWQSKFYAPDSWTGGGFGCALAMTADGTIALVGSNYHQGPTGDEGATYLYERTGSLWTMRRRILSSGHEYGERFGRAVALSANAAFALIGARYKDFAGVVDTGVLYHYNSGSLDGSVVLEDVVKPTYFDNDDQMPVRLRQKLYPKSKNLQDLFGHDFAVSADETIMAVSRVFAVTGGSTKAGQVDLYTKDASGNWVFQQTLTSAIANANFGSGLALNSTGDRLLIGARDETGTYALQGAAYYYTRSGNAWTQQQKFTYSPVLNDSAVNFGEALAMNAAGDYALISAVSEDGAFTNMGAVYIFTRSGNVWTQQGKIIAPDAAAEDRFGAGVALNAAGDYAVIASSLSSVSGKIYAYRKSGSNWVFQQIITAPDNVETTWFGCSLALSQDACTLLVGAAHKSDLGSRAGAAYLYTRVGGEWVYRRKVHAPDGVAVCEFGRSVDISASGACIYAGAQYDMDFGTSSGALYAFESTVMKADLAVEDKLNFVTHMVAGDSLATDRVGADVAMSADGTQLVIGASSASNGSVASGVVYYYTRSGTAWVQQQKIIPPDGAATDLFGEAIALNSDATQMLIGAYGDDDTAVDSGSVYYYTRSGNVWTYQNKIHAADPLANVFFGISVSLNAAGDYAAIGAFNYAGSGVVEGGGVYIFTRSGTTWTQQQKIYSTDIATSDHFGQSVSLSGDATKLLVGATWDDDNVADSGSVYYFTRSGSVWTQVSKFTSPNPAVNGRFGGALATNASFDVVLVGEYGGDIAGQVHLYKRTGSTWVYASSLSTLNKVKGAGFGYGVAMSADGSYAVVGQPAHDYDTVFMNGVSLYVNLSQHPEFF